MAENPPRLVRKQHPQGGIERAEECEQQDIEKPQNPADGMQNRGVVRKLINGQGEDAGAHRYGEPIGREVPDRAQQARRFDRAAGWMQGQICHDRLRMTRPDCRAPKMRPNVKSIK